MSLLVDIQTAVAAQLDAQPFFSGSVDSQPVPVIPENKGDIETMVATAVGQIGVCAVVAIGDAPVAYPDIPGARKAALNVSVIAYETPIVNRDPAGTGKTALEVAEQAEQALHLVLLPVAGVTHLVSKGIFPAEGPAGVLAYSVRLILDAGGGQAERVIPTVTWPPDPPPVPGVEYAKLEDGKIKIKNLTTSRWHSVYVVGPLGAEQLAVDAGEDEP